MTVTSSFLARPVAAKRSALGAGHRCQNFSPNTFSSWVTQRVPACWGTTRHRWQGQVRAIRRKPPHFSRRNVVYPRLLGPS